MNLPATITTEIESYGKKYKKTYNFTVIACADNEWYANYTFSAGYETERGDIIDIDYSADFNNALFPLEDFPTFEEAISDLRNKVALYFQKN